MRTFPLVPPCTGCVIHVDRGAPHLCSHSRALKLANEGRLNDRSRGMRRTMQGASLRRLLLQQLVGETAACHGSVAGQLRLHAGCMALSTSAPACGRPTHHQQQQARGPRADGVRTSLNSRLSLADLLVAQPEAREQLIEGSRQSAMQQVQSALRSHCLPAEAEPATGAPSLHALSSLPVRVHEGGARAGAEAPERQGARRLSASAWERAGASARARLLTGAPSCPLAFLASGRRSRH